MISRLELAARVREGEVFAGRATRTERRFLDFVIDGKSLWEMLKKPDMVSILCFEYAAAAPHESFKAVNRLLLLEEADHADNRRSLFICPECGDLGCAAISCVISRADNVFIWQDFGGQHNYDDALHPHLAPYQSVGPFIFDAAAYEALLKEGPSQFPNL